MLDLNKCYCMDCLEGLRALPDKSIDVQLTSPPYNMRQHSYGGRTTRQKWINAALADGYEDYDDCMPDDEYAAWQHEVLLEMARVMKDDGVIFYNHKWRILENKVNDRRDIVYDVPLRQIIIWQRNGGMNFRPGYFLPTYEVIYMIAGPQFKLAPKANALGDVWSIPQERGNPHPAPFPIELATRAISSTTGRVVLDPFMGSGTTALAAERLGREWIGFERCQRFVDMCEERIRAERAQKKLPLT